ncbi:helix-turn-helix transcriptional regulator [Carnobacterium maltaromaticum]|uniref:Helix-turn-helix transcriptional regulator n=1 Tax=Carnobacterium maltaromaticum TaxID=2751 RepID=A0AAW9K0W8_CARML|nr:helix-turn-helix transcriptional regulator [Carnobacterium maltaromaticum]MDZ5759386.1 helix-turn-helix transcriptional regulator [Carnobacterium maltaromaticum]
MARGELTPNDIKTRQDISNNINNLLKQQNKKQIDIHRATGIPKSTLTGYVKGTTTPAPGNIQKIANFFNVKKSDIDPRFSSFLKQQSSSSEINELYQQLEPLRKEKVSNFIKKQLEEQQKKLK